MGIVHRILGKLEQLISVMDLKDILILVILILVINSLFFFLATLFKRVRKIRQQKVKQSYQEEIDQLLFGVMFKEEDSSETGQTFFLTSKSNLYKKVMIKSLIGLHNNFSGVSSAKLEEFYVQSGLVHYSLRKLKSRNWVYVVEGIRDLAALNFTEAYPMILKIKFDKNDMVQQEKLIARIRLNGLQEIWDFKDSKMIFNDWTQSNILFAIKKYKVPPIDNLHELLQASNHSVVLLAVRLMGYYQNFHHYEVLKNFKASTKSSKVFNEINFMLQNKRYSRA